MRCISFGPPGLTILQACWGNLSHRGVFADGHSVHKGTRFGPFQGKLVNTSEIKTYDDNTLMWEVMPQDSDVYTWNPSFENSRTIFCFCFQVFENGKLSHFVDGRGGLGNWMSLVKCARFPDEQNLIAVQVEGQIFYEACKDIQPGQELLVWYGDCYMQFLGIPLTLKEAKEDSEALLPTEGQDLTFSRQSFYDLCHIYQKKTGGFPSRCWRGLQVRPVREGVRL